MTTSQSELLDLALDNWQKDPGMGFARTLQGDGSAIDRMVAAAEMVQALPALPVPDQVQARADREAFMARVQQLPPPAIPVEKGGFLAWLTQLLTASAQTRNEPRPMVPVFAKAVFILIAVVFFSLGGTAVLSASALPTSPIYPVKLVLEEARLSLTGSPAGQTALHLDFAAERAQEMARLAAFKLAPDQAQLQNFRAHWRQALLLAGELPDEDLMALLTQAQALAGDQERLLAGAQRGLPLDMQGHLEEAQRSVEQVQTAVRLGLQNQDRYRWHMRHLPEDWPGEGTSFGFGPGDCEGDCESEGGYAPGPGYGPGGGEAPGNEDPGDEDPGDEDPGIEDPGNEDPGNEDPGNEDPGNEDPGNDDPGSGQPGIEIPVDDFPGKGDPGNEDPGNEDPGHEAPGNEDPGNDSPGNSSPGNGDPGNEAPGSGGPGNTNPGNTDPGNSDPGSDSPGNDDPGNSDPGSDSPGNEDPGSEDPGDGDPGNENPGSGGPGAGSTGGGDPGNDDPGSDSPGSDSPGNEDPGNEDPGDGDPGDGNPGNENPGSGDPGGNGPGSNNSGTGGTGGKQ